MAISKAEKTARVAARKAGIRTPNQIAARLRMIERVKEAREAGGVVELMARPQLKKEQVAQVHNNVILLHLQSVSRSCARNVEAIYI